MDKFKAQLSLHKKYRQATIVKSTNDHSHNKSSINEVSSSVTISTASASFDSSTVSTSQNTSNGNVKHGASQAGNDARLNNANNNHAAVSSKSERKKRDDSLEYKAVGKTRNLVLKHEGNEISKQYVHKINGSSSELNKHSSVNLDLKEQHPTMQIAKLTSLKARQLPNACSISASQNTLRSNSYNDLTTRQGKPSDSYTRLNHGKNGVVNTDDKTDDKTEGGKIAPNSTKRRSSSQSRTSVHSKDGGYQNHKFCTNAMTSNHILSETKNNDIPSLRSRTPTPTGGRNFGLQKDHKEQAQDSSSRRQDNSSIVKKTYGNKSCQSIPKLPISASISCNGVAKSTNGIETRTPSISAILQASNTTTSNDVATAKDVTNHHSQSHSTNYYMVPTEAQLRWAQFHCKKRAQSVQKNIEQLMSYPLHEKDVDDARSGDGDSSINSTCSSSDESQNGHVGRRSDVKSTNDSIVSSKKQQKKKLKLSRGRRALLRVSARKTEERRKKIQLNGFAMHPDDDDFDKYENAQNDPSSDQQCLDDSFEIDDITQALHVNLIDDNTLFAGRKTGNSSGRDMGIIGSTIVSGKKKKKSSTGTYTKKSSSKGGAKHLKGKRSMVATADEEEERMKRFEEAYIAICNAGESTKGTTESFTIRSGKRWTRGTGVPVAVSIDGREYDDMQRSPAFKDLPNSRHFAAQIYGAEINGKQLSDRVASWMMHLPKKSTLRDGFAKVSPHFLRNTVTSHQCDENDVSPQKMKLMELVDRLQGQQNYPDTNAAAGKVVEKEKYKDTKTEPNVLGKESIPEPLSIGVNVAKLRDKLLQSTSNDISQTGAQEFDQEEDDVFYFHSEDGMMNENIENKIHEMAAHVKASNSVIDTDMQSDVTTDDLEYRIGSLMLNPTIITKRLNQAIHAIESCQWDQVSYLVNANPWLAEMADINSNQYLLHKLSFYGAGNSKDFSPAPTALNKDMIDACPAAMQKFDRNGNLPLHLAAAACNADMVARLSEQFRGGGSVKNNQGHLPLHMAVIACSKYYDVTDQENFTVRLVKIILDLFPGGLAITDNNGNLPVHLASCHLNGPIGAEVMHVLLQKAAEVGKSLRFSTCTRVMQNIDEPLTDFDADHNVEDSSIYSCRNTMNWTPLMAAVKNRAGWQVLDSILCRDEVEAIMFDVDENGKNVLQLSLEDEYCDPPSTLSILKFFPKLVTRRDENGALPIEIACLRGFQEEIIMAIALLDLPIDLDATDNLKEDSNRAEFGGSWWYLNCECDDEYAKIVGEILEICNYKQKQALCFAKNDKGRSLLRRATPKCKKELRKALRFDGRYEFVGNRSTNAGDSPKNFEALDFGNDEDPIPDGQKVTLLCYSNEMKFASEVSLYLHLVHLSLAIFFSINDSDPKFALI